MSLRAWAIWLALVAARPAWAAFDSYRYLHVTIETPWAIFVGLFFLVVFPVALAVFLQWKYAKPKEDDDDADVRR